MSRVNLDLPIAAATAVQALVHSQLDKSDPEPDFEVYIVWFSKTLKNWKALVSTSLPDLRYYEVTHNGDTGETYIDTYTKLSNHVIRDTE